MGTIYPMDDGKHMRFHNFHVDFTTDTRTKTRERRTDICTRRKDGKIHWFRPSASGWRTSTDCNYRDWALTRKFAYKPLHRGDFDYQDQLGFYRTEVYLEGDKIPWAAVGCKTRAALVNVLEIEDMKVNNKRWPASLRCPNRKVKFEWRVGEPACYFTRLNVSQDYRDGSTSYVNWQRAPFYCNKLYPGSHWPRPRSQADTVYRTLIINERRDIMGQ
ncbi:hypothetical protein RvY_17159-1 [Ramazzottius varieornatus]|uniref:Uncharacterized protein n=1 Tax=Ramazzottius varieornatus TaxID=947166 RepID=A0A1D1W171_RAMVA|nr:hypothetical protein RvY_17159-1 [Ramazzottius varieornatus]